MKFVKLPVVIEATQWFKMGDHPVVVQALSGDFAGVHTLEGFMRVTPSDWIITGVKGEHYPCKDEIFKLTYRPYDEDEIYMAALGPCGK